MRPDIHHTTVDIGGVRVSQVRLYDVLEIALFALQDQASITILNANAHAIVLANRYPTFKEALNSADLVFCDGFGVLWAARLLGNPIPERFTPPDWIPQLAALCSSRDRPLYLLGSTSPVVSLAARKLEESMPGLQVYSHHGFFDRSDAGNAAIIEQINASGAGILLVGLGMPVQEIWIQQHRSQLRPNVILSVGALFDYISGHVKRGPNWMTNHGMEWLSRLLIEPERLWRRYLMGLPQFAWIVMRQKLSLIQQGH